MTAPDDSPTRVGGRYRLEERIGAGAMGAVWRATDELLNRTVAVKQLLAAAAPATDAGLEALEESRQRILREGRIGARLQHPHVISMFDVVVHEDSPWLVMEYLPSHSLAQVLAAQGSLSPLEAADIGRQVADGLAAAHTAGVVHRDVKPGNVLIADSGLVKLTDFGVSRAVDDVQLTRTGLIAGTPAFLSPEVARGHDPAAASDVFALGATLYAAVEGRPPFGIDDNAYALLHKVATGAVVPPERAGALAGILARLLATDPDTRPTAAQARDELAAVATGTAGPAPDEVAATVVTPRPTGSRPDPAPAPAAGERRRGPLLVGLVAAVVLLLGGGLTAAALASRPGSDAAAAPAATSAPVSKTVAPVTAPSVTSTPVPTPEPTAVPPTAVPPTAVPPTTTPAPTPSPAPDDAPVPAAPAPSDPVAFVQGYYALLPGNPEAAFARLSPQAQARSGGRSFYVRFWSEMSSVSLQDARADGDSAVVATVVFDRRNGPTTREPYRFEMTTGADGTTIMQAFNRV